MSSRLERVVEKLAGDLRALGRCGALIGGLAVSAWTEPRFTRDVDLAIAVADDAEAEALVLALSGRGFRALAAVEQTTAARLATVRLVSPTEPSDEGVVVDLLFASSGIEAEIVAAAEPLESFPGCRVAVARPGHLVALKLLARDDAHRPQDIADLRALAPLLDAAELALAREGVRLIEQRGYARGRDLTAALAALVSA